MTSKPTRSEVIQHDRALHKFEHRDDHEQGHTNLQQAAEGGAGVVAEAGGSWAASRKRCPCGLGLDGNASLGHDDIPTHPEGREIFRPLLRYITSGPFHRSQSRVPPTLVGQTYVAASPCCSGLLSSGTKPSLQ